MGGWVLCNRCDAYAHTHDGGGLVKESFYCEPCYPEVMEE
jgi:hypothetical protein